jgi:pyridoxal phosphate enzyme (YggS family)
MIETKRITDNYSKICEDISKVNHHVTLVAVTKGHPIENILPLYHAGCRNFGENRIQDALLKISDLPQDISWHHIGTLQKNKVRKGIENFVLIQGVDSFELCAKISECSVERNQVTPILFQVNTSCETTKHGFSSKSLQACFHKTLLLPGIKSKGLMTMAPLTNDERVVRNCFLSLRLLLEELNAEFPDESRKTLSMGMSHDYKLALEEGSTMVRIGSALFN